MTRRLLCVNRSSCEREAMASELKDLFEVHKHHSLDAAVLDLFREQEKQGRAFDAMVTQFPYDRNMDISSLSTGVSSYLIDFCSSYSQSLSVLNKVRWDYPDTFILVHSGAASSERAKNVILGFGDADAVVEKRDDLDTEIFEIRKRIIEFYNKPPRRWNEIVKAEIKPPEFTLSEGYTTVTAVINRYFGLKALAAFQHIAKISREHPKEVKLRTGSSVASGKDTIRLLGLSEIEIGRNVEINVEGADEKAKETASKLYGIITSKEDRP